MGRPKPDWGRNGTQPRGTLGPPPPPNGRPVAMKPGPSNLIQRTPNPWPLPGARDDAEAVTVRRDDLALVIHDDPHALSDDWLPAYRRLMAALGLEGD